MNRFSNQVNNLKENYAKWSRFPLTQSSVAVSLSKAVYR